jgi:hypothetical protein
VRITVRLGSIAALLGGAACLQLGTGASDAGTSSAAGASGSATHDAGNDAPTGAGCVVDPASGVTLCTRISICADLAIDHDVYPNCGFRLPANSLEVDCVCGDFLCPLGVSLNCAQLRDLLDSQSEIVACSQASEGRCAETKPPTPPSNTCDRNCLSTCGGDPGCARLCGC